MRDDVPIETPLPRILLVDDEPAVRQLLQRLLKGRYACECFEAADGIEALNLLRKQDIDVAIVDLTMPRMDGLSLLRGAKDEKNSAAWIILSGAGGFDEAVEAIHLGAFDYIAKPIHNVDELIITVRNAVRQRRLEADRDRLMKDIEERNYQLADQVVHLQEACRILTNQQETIEADLHRAELIQRAMLPLHVPEISNFAINTVYRPSRIVGGDLYDLVTLPSGHVVVYVADAAGHGLSAAMLAVLFKHRVPLWDDRIEQPIAPSEVLQTVNTCLWEECKAPGLFVTAVYALVEPDGEHVTISSAGHPPTILSRTDGSFELINGDSPALGLNEWAEYPQKVLSLSLGDRLLMYTDGMFNCLDMNDALTAEGIANVITSSGGDSRGMLDRLLDVAAQRRKGYSQEDDITMVMLALGETASSVDNSQLESETQSELPASTPSLRIGQDEQGTVICLNGRGCWTHSADFFEVCLQELCPDRSLTLDLSYCEYLDSTFLGTLQELVDQADQEKMPLFLQHVPPVVMDMFRELGMTRVLQRILDEKTRVPEDLTPVLYGGFSDRDHQHRVLHAHEALAELNENNRKEFNRLIGMLRRELEPYTVRTGK